MTDQTKNNGHVPQKPIPPSGPSKSIRNGYVRQVKKIAPKSPPPKKHK